MKEEKTLGDFWGYILSYLLLEPFNVLHNLCEAIMKVDGASDFNKFGACLVVTLFALGLFIVLAGVLSKIKTT